MELFRPKIKTFFYENSLRFFITVFSSFFIFTPDFYHCFSVVFSDDCIFSCHRLSLLWLLFCCFFASYFAFALLHRECYGFSAAYLTLRRFLLYISSPRFPQYRECCEFERTFFYAGRFFTLHSFLTFGTTAFIKTSLRVGSSSLKVVRPPAEVVRPPAEVRKTDPAHLFVWIIQYWAKGTSWWVVFMR